MHHKTWAACSQVQPLAHRCELRRRGKADRPGEFAVNSANDTVSKTERNLPPQASLTKPADPACAIAPSHPSAPTRPSTQPLSVEGGLRMLAAKNWRKRMPACSPAAAISASSAAAVDRNVASGHHTLSRLRMCVCPSRGSGLKPTDSQKAILAGAALTVIDRSPSTPAKSAVTN
jgi:hypothetical protein